MSLRFVCTVFLRLRTKIDYCSGYYFWCAHTTHQNLITFIKDIKKQY